MDSTLENPFERVDVRRQPDGHTRVRFVVRPIVPYPRPWTFRVERKDYVGSDWNVIASDLVLGEVLLNESDERYDLLSTARYRVVLEADDLSEGLSDVVYPGMILNKQDWLIAKEVCRRKYKQMRLYTGREGTLLAPDHSSVPCDVCVSPVNGQSMDPNCSTCNGTGYLSGYSAIDYPLEIHKIQSDREEQSTKGTRSELTMSATGIASPMPEPDEYIWVDHSTGYRYHVSGPIIPESHIRGMPLVIGMRLHRISPKDEVYDVPVE